ncbi:MAG: M23 family metallopeptidase [Muribaculaceae bacterium]|nr:M23 family metallopeptidase [Muribaculaceae bacterium]
MAKLLKQLYLFDPVTGEYLPVRNPRDRFQEVLLYCVSGAIAVAIIVLPLFLNRESARMAELRNRYEALESDYEELLKRTEEMSSVINEHAERDKNFYRVLLNADPISDSDRRSAIRRQLILDYSADSLSGNMLASAVSNSVDLLEEMLYVQSKSYDALKEVAARHRDRLDCIPAIQPLSDKHLRAVVSGFGTRSDPMYGISKPHEGIDYSAPVGTPVYATGCGTVMFAGWRNGYGYTIDIDHGFDYLTRFAHLSSMCVSEGQKVVRGQEIGAVGCTGKSTGPHLHYEVRYKDIARNPADFYFFDLTPDEYDRFLLHSQNAVRVMD